MSDPAMLSQAQFQRAKQFVFEHARPLERRLFEFHFENGASADVLAELERFQNEDGGFGNALEPDFRLPDSSAMATSVGLQVLREVDAPASHPQVRGALDYLLQTFDDLLQRWEAVPARVAEFPRAPWWGTPAQPEPGFRANPSAELIGHFHRYLDATAAAAPAARLQQWTELAVAELETMAAPSEMHDLLCYLWLERSLPRADRVLVRRALTASGAQIVTRDPEQWESYCAKPLWLAPCPDALLAGVLGEEIQINLDYEIAHQGEDGAWSPFWTWGDAYPDVWPQAEREWKGILTVNTLKSLSAFGRLER